MEEAEITILLTAAIVQRRKINLQMQDTADENFILFQPHCIVTDSVENRYEVFGYVERHYAHDQMMYAKIAQFRGIKTITLLDDTFEPVPDWRTALGRFVPHKDEQVPIDDL